MGHAIREGGVNRVLLWLIVLSAAAHLVVLLYVSGVVKVKSYTQIKVGLMDQAPPPRALPRPRLRPPQPKTLAVANPLEPPSRPLPAPPMTPVESPRAEPDGLSLAAAPAPAQAGPALGDLAAPELSLTRAEMDAYQELVRQRIAREKRYPQAARRRQAQGRVTVVFVIGPKGNLSSIKLKGTTGHPALDRAAREAVTRAAPFPAPPASSGKGGLNMEVVIAFELY